MSFPSEGMDLLNAANEARDEVMEASQATASARQQLTQAQSMLDEHAANEKQLRADLATKTEAFSKWSKEYFAATAQMQAAPKQAQPQGKR